MSFNDSGGIEKKWLQFAAANALKYAETGVLDDAYLFAMRKLIVGLGT